MNKKQFETLLDDLLKKEISVVFGHPVDKIKRGTPKEILELITQYSLIYGSIEYKIIEKDNKMKRPRLYIYEIKSGKNIKNTDMLTYLIQYPDGTCEYFYDKGNSWNISAWTGTTARLDLDKDATGYFEFVGYL